LLFRRVENVVTIWYTYVEIEESNLVL